MYQLYTLFCIKIKKIFLFFLNPGTIGTIKKSVVYQRLYVQICTKGAWYNEVQLVQLLKKLVIPTKYGVARMIFYIYLLLIQKGVYRI